MSNYMFTANALAAGGAFTYNGDRVVVPSLASATLSPSGGLGRAFELNYRTPALSFDSATTMVDGNEIAPDEYVTESQVQITGLEVLKRFRVKVLNVQVRSTRNLRDAGTESKFEIKAFFDGIQFDNGPICPHLDLSICSSTYDQLGAAEIDELQEMRGTAELVQVRKDEHKVGAPIHTTLVRDVTAPPGLAVAGARRKNVVKVPGFAKIHFGELVAKRGRRRVNLLRFEFGMLDDDAAASHIAGSGSLTIAAGDGNGEPIWPRG